MYIMKEDTLTQIKNEVEITKLNIEKNNEMVKKIKELEKNRYVRDYLSLVGLSNTKQKFITDTDDEIISQIYDKYIHRIDERDTNGIYIYLGTFRYSSTADIVSLGDDRVSYDDDRADYRLYQDLEQLASLVVNIKDCKVFEENNTIINPNGYFKSREYYKIQKEFFITAVKKGQETARRRILKKYPGL